MGRFMYWHEALKANSRNSGVKMAFIASEEHFINFLRKVFRDAGDEVDKNETLEAEAYLELIYRAKLTDKFTWAVKRNPKLLENEHLAKWLQTTKCNGVVYIPSALEHVMTTEFHDEIRNLNGVPGVYSFWTKGGIPLYVGMSINLSDRIMGSFSERFLRYKTQVYLRFIKTNTTSDAALLEIYFIAKLKPSLNGTSKYGDDLTVEIDPIPEFSEKIQCNRVQRK